MRIHLDTDLGGDIDDLGALAMLLGRPGVELTGITTVAEEGGRRAGYAHHALALVRRLDVPVAAGVDVSSGRYPYPLDYPSDDDYWGGPVPPRPGPVDAALDLLERSIDLGATITAIGPFSNLAALEARRPGILARARLVLMGGWVYPPRAGLPPWGWDVDYNVQVDAAAAEVVLAAARPTLVTLPVSLEATLRRAYLPVLRRGGPLAQLVGRQAEAFAREWRNEERWGKPYAGVPDDTINFLYDPLAAAIAAGWSAGVRTDVIALSWQRENGQLRLRPNPMGKALPVVVAVDGRAFEAEWLRCVARV